MFENKSDIRLLLFMIPLIFGVILSVVFLYAYLTQWRKMPKYPQAWGGINIGLKRSDVSAILGESIGANQNHFSSSYSVESGDYPGRWSMDIYFDDSSGLVHHVKYVFKSAVSYRYDMSETKSKNF